MNAREYPAAVAWGAFSGDVIRMARADEDCLRREMREQGNPDDSYEVRPLGVLAAAPAVERAEAVAQIIENDGDHFDVLWNSTTIAKLSVGSKLYATAERAEALLKQAQIWKQEARTANATIAEIYQLCTGATGEPGNWNGANPVREALAAERAKTWAAAIEAALSTFKQYMDLRAQANANLRRGLDAVRALASAAPGDER